MNVASIRSRCGGYIIDMVIFAAVAMIMTVIAGFLLLLTTDWAKQDATDADFYLFLGIIGIGTALAWTLLNLLVLFTRSQTGGQYVAAIRIVREDGTRVRRRDALLWWFCFNPLLFSWPMAAVAGFPLSAVIFLVLSRFTIVVFGVLITICFAAPVIALVSALLDAHNRALHDRIAGIVAVPAE